MARRVPAPALSHLRPGLRLAGAARPVIGLQGRRAARAAARGRRAAPRESPAQARLGRPGGPRGADPAAAGTAAIAPAGHPRDRPALAPPPDRPQVALSAPDGTAAGQCRGRRADRAARHREQRLGLQEDPRGAAEARPPGQRIHHPPDPQGPEDPACAATAHRHDLAEVPPRTGSHDARGRLLPRGLPSDPTAPVLLLRDRGPLPVRAHPRCHREPGRAVDRAAGPQPADGPG
jgi:hypothetical protein